MDRQKAEYIRQVVAGAIEQALEEEGYDMTVVLGNCRFHDTGLRYTSLEINEGSPKDVQRNKFREHCFRLGLDDNDFGAVFRFAERNWKLVGLQPRARKYPFICEDLDNGDRKRLPKSALLAIIQRKQID